MGDEHDGDAELLIESVDGTHNLGSALRVEHGGRLIKHYALGLHGEHARYGDPLLLTAGELMRLPVAQLIHIDAL